MLTVTVSIFYGYILAVIYPLIAKALFSAASIISRSPSPLRARPFRTPRGTTFCVASRDYLLSVLSKACSSSY